MRVIIRTNATSVLPEYAGSTWVRLQYVLGFDRLGVEAFWVDEVTSWDPFKSRRSLDAIHKRFRSMAWDFGFQDRYCIIFGEGEQHFGLDERRLTAIARDADLVMSIGGCPTDLPCLLRIPRRAHIDVDPGFTQMWALVKDMGLNTYNFFFTVGQNVGGPDFKFPCSNQHWQRTVPPVVLDAWTPEIDPQCETFSTVADWRSSQVAEYQGERYEGKRSEFIRFIDVPEKAAQDIELALCIGAWDYEDIGLLCRKGWCLVNPYQFAGDPHSYRDFIRYSRAEFSVAKHGYVKSKSGWISDRTVCYLSSGKPALVQSTGFEHAIPTGKGLLTFSTVEEAVTGIEEINRNYIQHCRAARELAEKYFDSGLVLGRILERVGL